MAPDAITALFLEAAIIILVVLLIDRVCNNLRCSRNSFDLRGKKRIKI